MNVLIAGDIHGQFGALNGLINKKKPDITIQCGDNTYYWCGKKEIDRIKPGKSKVYLVPGNHECMSKDTEILTADGWKLLKDVHMHDKVASFNIKTKHITYSPPKKLYKKYQDNIIVIESNNLKQKVSYNHDVIFKDVKIKAKEFLSFSNVRQNDFPLYANKNSDDYDIKDNIIKILSWVVADATIVDHKKYNKNSKKIVIQFKLSKERKIKRLHNLLDLEDFKYTFKKCKKSKHNVLQPYYTRVYGDYARLIYKLLNYKKEFPRFFTELSNRQFNLFLDEIKLTDGCVQGNRIIYRDKNINNMNILNEMCTLNGRASKIKKEIQHKNAFGNFTYILTIQLGKMRYNYPVTIKEEGYNDYVYCASTHDSTLISRVDGKVGLTGNCWDLLEAEVGRRSETPIEVEDNIYYCPIGSSIEINEKKLLFIGGGESIDKLDRTIFIDWFPQETLTQGDMEYILDKNSSADYIFSHTCPLVFDIEKDFRGLHAPYGKREDPSKLALDEILKELKPDFWYFGHYHMHIRGSYKNTRWACLNKIDEPFWWEAIEI